MKDLFKKKLIKNSINKKFILLNTIIFSLVLFFIIVSPAKADLGADVAKVVGWIIYPIIAFVGWLASFIIGTLVEVAGFSKIIDADPVVKGWVIVRDLCNMFFILILLVIAFATILRIESYNYKKLLPKLLIMAVLINFSRTICGLIIDCAQVIMLTFVTGFGAGANNFVNTLKIKEFLAFSTGEKTPQEVTGTSMLASIIAALVFSIIVLITVMVLLAVLVMRIIMLWIYVILSPIAFLAAAFPAGQKYSSQWWGEFSKHVIVGPVLAFFIWLALSTAKGAGTLISPASDCNSALLNSLMCSNTFSTFIISIGMLIGGLMVTQQMGGMAASIAGQGMAAVQKMGTTTGKAAMLPLVGAKKLAGVGLDTVSKAVGIDLNVARGFKRVKAQMDENKRVRENKIYGRAVETAQKGGFIRSKLALGSTGDLGWKNITTWNKGRNLGRIFMGGKWAESFKDKAKVLENERKGVITKEENSKEIIGMGKQREEIKTIDTDMQKQQDIMKGALSLSKNKVL